MDKRPSYQIITRRGIINAGTKTNNQCKAVGHEKYYYELAILFKDDVQLDEKQFIIDHQCIDDEVQKVQINSCEVMAKTILSNMEAALCHKGIGYIGMLLKIQHDEVLPLIGPYFREARCEKEDLALVLSLL